MNEACEGVHIPGCLRNGKLRIIWFSDDFLNYIILNTTDILSFESVVGID